MSFGTRKKTECPQQELSTPDRMLLAILAATDATWLPFRHENRAPIAEARMRYIAAGVAWNSKFIGIDLSTAGRKAAQRQLAEIGLNGLVIAHNPSGRRTLCAKLTEAGSAKARAMIGGPVLAESLEMVDALYRLRDHEDGFDWLGEAWTRETQLTGAAEYGTGQDGEFHNLAIIMCPALGLDLVKSNSDTQMHVSYSLTASGEKVARERIHQRPKPAPIPKATPGAEDYYCTKLREATGALFAAEPEHENELGEIPLSVRPPTRRMIAKYAEKQPAGIMSTDSAT